MKMMENRGPKLLLALLQTELGRQKKTNLKVYLVLLLGGVAAPVRIPCIHLAWECGIIVTREVQ